MTPLFSLLLISQGLTVQSFEDRFAKPLIAEVEQLRLDLAAADLDPADRYRIVSVVVFLRPAVYQLGGACRTLPAKPGPARDRAITQLEFDDIVIEQFQAGVPWCEMTLASLEGELAELTRLILANYQAAAGRFRTQIARLTKTTS